MGLVVAGGSVALYEAYDPMPAIASSGPTMPWFVADKPCDYPSYERTLPDFDWGGKKPGLTLCFQALDNGKIPYAVAPTPPEERARQERQDKEDLARVELGEPPPLRFLMKSPWFYADDSYSQRVSAYTDKAGDDLKIEPELKRQLTSTSWRWRAFKKAWSDVSPWVVGICFGIWLITTLIGWIIRGFAGVPTGEDFRPKAQADA